MTGLPVSFTPLPRVTSPTDRRKPSLVGGTSEVVSGKMRSAPSSGATSPTQFSGLLHSGWASPAPPSHVAGMRPWVKTRSMMLTPSTVCAATLNLPVPIAFLKWLVSTTNLSALKPLRSPVTVTIGQL